MAYCVAANCNNLQTTPGITMHELRCSWPTVWRKWIKFIQFKRSDFLAVPHHAHLCSEHFSECNFANPMEYRYSFKILPEILNHNLEKINEWAKKLKVRFNKEKTEQLNFIRGQNQNQQLTFGSTTLKETPSHKYLGIILQNNCRWDEHIRSVLNETSMLISCLWSYKYKISRKVLETMYKSFILPLFDYADIVWDNCTDAQSKMLESLHLEAIRIIIGGICGTSHQKLYKGSGFCTLKERRKQHKLLMFHKMILGLCPQYISDLLPPLVAHINLYHRHRPLERMWLHAKLNFETLSFHLPQQSGILSPLVFNKVQL